jgi:threonine dehydratase
VLTLTDGIAVKHSGFITETLIRKWVDEIVAVDEDSVADAVGVSALLTARVIPVKTDTTCIVLSGGKVDLGLIPNTVRRQERKEDRRLIVFIRIADRPGGLARLLTIFADLGANLIEVQHVRDGLDLHIRETGVQVALEITGPDHAESLLAAAKADGYDVTKITSR